MLKKYDFAVLVHVFSAGQALTPKWRLLASAGGAEVCHTQESHSVALTQTAPTRCYPAMAAGCLVTPEGWTARWRDARARTNKLK